jgi:hypothetical protein
MPGTSRFASVSCVSEKSLFMQGISSDTGGTPDQVRQHIVHVLNEWAELAPDQDYTIHVLRTTRVVHAAAHLDNNRLQNLRAPSVNAATCYPIVRITSHSAGARSGGVSQ